MENEEFEIKELTEGTLLWWANEFKEAVTEYILNILELLGDDDETVASFTQSIVMRFIHNSSFESFQLLPVEELMKDDAFAFDVALYAKMCIKVQVIISPSEYIDAINVISEIPISDKHYGKMVPMVRMIDKFEVPVNLIPKRILNMCYQSGEYIKANQVINSMMNERLKECRECFEQSTDFDNFLSSLDAPLSLIVRELHDSDCYDHKSSPDIKTILTAFTVGLQGNIPGIYNYPDVLDHRKEEEQKLVVMSQIVRAAYEITKGGIDGD